MHGSHREREGRLEYLFVLGSCVGLYLACTAREGGAGVVSRYGKVASDG